MYSEVDGVAPTSNAPLRGGKATMFEGGTRVPCVIAWPGLVQAGTRSEALIQSEDYYPTILEGLALTPAVDQRFDGVSLLPALRGQALTRDAVFQYFPHNPAVPDWLPPAVSIHRGDWKLIRIFHGGDHGAHRHLLFHLRDDLGEKNNLASGHPSLVAELDARIDQFLVDTRAVTPIPNPAFDPARYRPELEGQPKPKRQVTEQTAAGADPLQGWKARGCQADVNNGILTVSRLSDASFLGFSAAKHTGPSTVKVRIKDAAGASHLDWLPGGVQDKARSVPFTLAGGDWRELTISVPATGPLGIVRLYLPKQDHPIAIDWIEIKSEPAGKFTRTGF